MPLDMPTAQGDVRAIVGQPFFVPLYNLFRVYGGVFRLSFGPKVPLPPHDFLACICSSSLLPAGT